MESGFVSAEFKRAVAGFITGHTGGLDLTNQLMSLHDGTTGDGSINEIEGGDYVRTPVMWGQVREGGENTSAWVYSSPVIFWLPPCRITHYGIWAGDTFLYGKELPAPVELAEGGSIGVTASHAYGLQP